MSNHPFGSELIFMETLTPYTKAESPYSKRTSPYQQGSKPYSPGYSLNLLLLEDGTALLLETGLKISL